jgi:hypothetical protein
MCATLHSRTTIDLDEVGDDWMLAVASVYRLFQPASPGCRAEQVVGTN